WRVHFEHLIRSEIMQAKIHVAFCKLYLHGAVVQVQKAETRVLIHADGCYVEMQFCSRPLIGVQVISDCERAVHVCRRPLVDTRRLHRNISVDVIEPRDAVGWIFLRISRDRKNCGQNRGSSESLCELPKCSHHVWCLLPDRCAGLNRRYRSALLWLVSKTKLIGGSSLLFVQKCGRPNTRYFECSAAARILAIDFVVEQHHITRSFREFSAIALVRMARQLVYFFPH